jgi:hypothetical protein
MVMRVYCIGTFARRSEGCRRDVAVIPCGAAPLNPHSPAAQPYTHIGIIDIHQEAVFVLHVFQKKATRGRETPKPDLDLIKDRLKAARDAAKGL